MSKEIFKKLILAREYVENQLKNIKRPEIGIVLGTGLSEIGEKINKKAEILYKDIPNFPVSTVDTHKGKMIFGDISGKSVVIMQGRVHLYEGYSPQDVCFGVRLAGLLGINTIILTNAAGAINPQFKEGNIMVISDHINFQGKNPLVGPNIDELGERFPDMSCVYDKELIELTLEAGIDLGFRLEQGVYVAVLGPSLETPAETRALKRLGGDAVGMSTVMEAIAARHMGLKVLGLSCLTNKNLPDCMKETSFEYIVEQANKTSRRLIKLLVEIVKRI
ncbi:purine-nucleoside phosphorylase [Desulfothermus naphthae]